ncbi:hypothetical protein MASR2M79_19230 [Aminivibrio sp.]
MKGPDSPVFRGLFLSLFWKKTAAPETNMIRIDPWGKPAPIPAPELHFPVMVKRKKKTDGHDQKARESW